MKQSHLVLGCICLAILGLGVVSCGSSKSGEHDHSGHDMSISETNDEMQAATVSVELTRSVILSYLQIKDALVQTDAVSAGKAASELLENLKGQEGLEIEAIAADIEKIANMREADEQRESFNSLSQNVYAVVKSNSANERALYKQYCPMAFDNTGAYWLSAEEEVLNPYFGDKMLKCGSVKETLK